METSASRAQATAVFAPTHVRLIIAFTALGVWSPIPFLALFGLPGLTGKAVFVALAVLGILVALRAVRVRLAIDDRGVTVVNYVRTRSFAWESLARVSLSSESFLLEGPGAGIKFTLRNGSSFLSQASLAAGSGRGRMLEALRTFAVGWPVVFDVPE
jgi:hypothetical protein